MRKEVGKMKPNHIKDSMKSALKRFYKQYPDLDVKDIKTDYFGKGQYETEIIIKEQRVHYGDTWTE